jgi:hypothetical protein
LRSCWQRAYPTRIAFTKPCSMGFVSVIIVSALFALGLPLVVF